METTDSNQLQVHQVTLASKTYNDTTYINKPVNSAYIQCSWFSPEEIKFIDTGP